MAFRALAGAAAAHIVVIPTASVGDAGPPGMISFLVRRNKGKFGVSAVTVLHSSTVQRPIRTASLRCFEPLREFGFSVASPHSWSTHI